MAHYWSEGLLNLNQSTKNIHLAQEVVRNYRKCEGNYADRGACLCTNYMYIQSMQQQPCGGLTSWVDQIFLATYPIKQVEWNMPGTLAYYLVLPFHFSLGLKLYIYANYQLSPSTFSIIWLLENFIK